MKPISYKSSDYISLRGYIDAGSLSGAVAAFNFAEPKDTYSWAWQNAIEVTSALIGTRHIRVSPEPNPIRPPTAPYGPVFQEFSQVLDIVQPPEVVLSSAYDSTKELVNKYQIKIKQIYARHQKDQKGFGNWLDWVISNSWSNHAARKGGVCDSVFLPEVAEILKITETDLREVQKLSACPTTLKSIARTQSPAYLFAILVDAFVISAIIRGIYYACVAHKMSIQLLCHQIREALFSNSSPQNNIEYRVSNTEHFLATIIVASAYREKNQRQRINEWSNSLFKARQAVHEEKVDLRFRKFDDVALDEAIRIAKLLDIRTKSKWIDKGINAGSAIGVGILTSFVLSPWAGFFCGLASGAAMDRFKVGDKATRLLETDYGLKSLAAASPGNISRNWMGNLHVNANDLKKIE